MQFLYRPSSSLPSLWQRSSFLAQPSSFLWSPVTRWTRSASTKTKKKASASLAAEKRKAAAAKKKAATAAKKKKLELLGTRAKQKAALAKAKPKFTGTVLSSFFTRNGPLYTFQRATSTTKPRTMKEVQAAFDQLPAATKELYEAQYKADLQQAWKTVVSLYRSRVPKLVKIEKPFRRLRAEIYAAEKYATFAQRVPGVGHAQLLKLLREDFETLSDADKAMYASTDAVGMVDPTKLAGTPIPKETKMPSNGGYLEFRRTTFDSLTGTMTERMTQLAQTWNELSKEEKEKWDAKADKNAVTPMITYYNTISNLSMEENVALYRRKLVQTMRSQNISAVRTRTKRGPTAINNFVKEKARVWKQTAKPGDTIVSQMKPWMQEWMGFSDEEKAKYAQKSE